MANATVACQASAQDREEYDAAVAARLDGRAAEAKQRLEAWLTLQPGDLDARIQLAYADLALGNLDAAEAGFRAVLAEAPGYADARSGLDLVSARRIAPADGWKMQVQIEGAISDLGGNSAGWSEAALGFAAKPSDTTVVDSRLSLYRRFGLNDFEFTGRLSVRASENLWIRASAGITPNADFRPEFELGGGLDVRIEASPGTVFTLDGGYQEFPAQTVIKVQPGLVQYLPGGRYWITLQGIGIKANDGRFQIGALVRADATPAPGWRFFVGGSEGPDTDLGVVARVTSLFAGGEAPLAQRVALTGSVTRDWRDTGSDRSELRMGLRVRY